MDRDSLPGFDTAFGRQIVRLRGINSWEQMGILGTANLKRLVQLAQERVYLLLAEGSSRDELQMIRVAINYVTELATTQSSLKPLLPRLRAENFRRGDAVVVYLGDSPGTVAPQPWVPAVITDVAKSYRAEWADGGENTGYYWRLTATASVPLFPDSCSVVFSTSEPRVLPAPDFEYVTNNWHSDAPFIETFCQNAWRAWEPLWCQEKGIQSAGASMDMTAWLKEHSKLA